MWDSYVSIDEERYIQSLEQVAIRCAHRTLKAHDNQWDTRRSYYRAISLRDLRIEQAKHRSELLRKFYARRRRAALANGITTTRELEVAGST